MREAYEKRQSRETDIQVKLNLDGSGVAEVSTQVGFFDHMLTAFSVHSGFDLMIKTVGDLQVDCHHTIEDTGIVLGRAFAAALGNKNGIERYGSFYIPMDEALAFATVDIGGRPYLMFDCGFCGEKVGDMDTAMVEEFFRAFAFHAGITLHIRLLYGANDHHKCEALFKAVAHALSVAVRQRENTVLSTKGMLD